MSDELNDILSSLSQGQRDTLLRALRLTQTQAALHGQVRVDGDQHGQTVGVNIGTVQQTVQIQTPDDAAFARTTLLLLWLGAGREYLTVQLQRSPVEQALVDQQRALLRHSQAGFMQDRIRGMLAHGLVRFAKDFASPDTATLPQLLPALATAAVYAVIVGPIIEQAWRKYIPALASEKVMIRMVKFTIEQTLDAVLAFGTRDHPTVRAQLPELQRDLSAPIYQEGIRNLLDDLLDPRFGQPQLLVAIQQAFGAHAPDPTTITTMIRLIGVFLGTAAVGGIIGNRADALLERLIQLVQEQPRPPAPASEPPQHGRAGDTSAIPITPPQWRTELARRNTTFGRPAGYFCFVPGGVYLIGGWGEHIEGQGKNRGARLRLAPFWIARYPITNAQWQAWVAAGGKPSYAADASRYNKANQPVVGVTWNMCRDFCAWLTPQLAAHIPVNYCIRLPTEAEWEVAAAYDAQGKRRRYPWGDRPEPAADHAIFADAQGNNLGAAAPVGGCVAGAAACGAADMAGNVWEWCASSYDGYPQAAATFKKDFTGDDRNTPVRGGSWWTDSAYIPFGARFRTHPDYWYNLNYDPGVRVVCAPCLR